MNFRTEQGGRIRRERPIAFHFDGQPYAGCEGDTLASALLANGVHLVGRSFKYHRPRGIFSAGSEEPNALVTVTRGAGRITPNLRATQVELHDGLRATSQNRYPSLQFDLGAAAGLAAPLLGAGFYYKTFMWPPRFWQRFYEPAIRAAAGLGRAPAEPDPDRYAHQYAHCDVLVVGGGPAGLAAALAASAGGARVILCDEQAELGGSLLAEDSATIDGVAAADWLAETLATLGASVTLLARTTAFGCYPDNLIGLVQRVTDHVATPAAGLPRERLWQVRAQQVVLAAGAIQRPLVFPNNDRPGMMLADTGRVYLQRYGVKVGSHVVVATAEDSAYRAALALQAAGVAVAAVVDQRVAPSAEWRAAVLGAGITVHAGTAVTGTEGRLRVHTAHLSGAARVLPCDTVLSSGGWTPSVHLFAQARGRLRFDDALGAFVPGESLRGMQAVGACAGVFDLARCLEQGYAAGEAAFRPVAAPRGFAVTGALSSLSAAASPWAEPVSAEPLPFALPQPSWSSDALSSEGLSSEVRPSDALSSGGLPSEGLSSPPRVPSSPPPPPPDSPPPDPYSPPPVSSPLVSSQALAEEPAASEAAAGEAAGLWPSQGMTQVQPEMAQAPETVRSSAMMQAPPETTRPPDPLRPQAPHSKAFVDLQNDVTTRDLAIAAQEGFRSVEHVKRYTTAGMATDQGKTSNINALAALSGLLDQPVPAIGLTTYRPPYTPVTFGTFAGAGRGELFDPLRLTPLHDWAAAHGALFEDVGQWRRARAFPRALPGMIAADPSQADSASGQAGFAYTGAANAAAAPSGNSPSTTAPSGTFPAGTESLEQAVARECRAVRTTCGIFDASTLGKIEVVGPDAGVFLDRLYTGTFSRLAPGTCRYAVLLGEDGCIRDDGVIARLASDRYHVTTTTGGAAGVLHHMEDYLQTEFPDLRVWLTSTTEHWAVIALQGPRAPEVLAPLAEGIAVAAMPHMSVREGRVGGIPARVFRVSFTGETGFEVNVPADHAAHIWNALLDVGAPLGLTPYGTEAMHVLRAEQGFIIVGQETDGTVTPLDLGLGWTIGRSKGDFIGRRSLMRPEMLRHDRRQLVGLLTADPAVLLEEGAQLVADPTVSVPAAMLGHVTSAYRSEALGRSIALALVAAGRARVGTTLYVPMPDRVIAVTVTAPAFLAGGMAGQAGERLGLSEGDGGRGPPPTGSGGLPPPPILDPPCDPSPQGEAEDWAGAPALPARHHPLHALGVVSPACAHARLTALAPITRILVRGHTTAATAIGRSLGVLLGSAPHRAVTASNRAALWLGPDEWLVLAPDSDADLAREATVALDTTPGSVVDVSHRSTSIELAGPYAAWCLNGFCALDLDPGVFPPGTATRTLFGKAEIVLWRTDADSFHIEVARSFARYVWECLEETRLELLDLPPPPP